MPDGRQNQEESTDPGHGIDRGKKNAPMESTKNDKKERNKKTEI